MEALDTKRCIRYDNRSLRGNNFYTKQDSVTGFFKQVINQDTAGSYLQFPAFNKTFAGFSFSAGMTYEVNQHVSLKANIARGFRRQIFQNSHPTGWIRVHILFI